MQVQETIEGYRQGIIYMHIPDVDHIDVTPIKLTDQDGLRTPGYCRELRITVAGSTFILQLTSKKNHEALELQELEAQSR